MRRIILAIIWVSVAVLMFSKVEAQTTTLATSTEPAEATTTPEAVPETALNESTAQNESVTPVAGSILSVAKQKRIINLAANISNRVEAMIRRLDNITKRLKSRISKLEAAGFNTNDAKESLSEAEAALQSARGRMSDIDKAVVSAITSESPHKDWPAVKDIYLKTRADLQLAKKKLEETIAALKNARPETDDGIETASSSNETDQ